MKFVDDDNDDDDDVPLRNYTHPSFCCSFDDLHATVFFFRNLLSAYEDLSHATKNDGTYCFV